MREDWRKEKFRIFGKEIWAPRSLAWYGCSGLNYRYTGIDHIASGWPEFMYTLRELVADTAEIEFNFVLVNRYENGREYMGWHRDNEKGSKPLIASLSLGAHRKFVIESEQARHTQILEHGSLAVFDGTQRHQLPKTKGSDDVRLNLTFRQLAPCD